MMPHLTSAARDAECRAAIARRDPEADGRFVYGVRTTGVYCRPSCPSRAARPENVALFATPALARQAGFRPCLRCRPDADAAPHAAAIEGACRRIEAAETPPTLADLARAAGLSPHHFHRLFRATTGVTPRAYGRAHRAARTATALAQAGTVIEAVFAGGYGAASRFYAEAPSRLGMTPSAYRRGGTGARIGFASAPCSLGTVLAAASERGVCAILLGDDPAALEADLRARFPAAAIAPAAPGFAETLASVVALVEAPALPVALPLDIGGTAFQQRVWEALRGIRPGATASYGEVARTIGAPGAVRAVARACGANPLAVAVPCHRVVGRDGTLTGYRWGVERKRALLAREAAGADSDARSAADARERDGGEA